MHLRTITLTLFCLLLSPHLSPLAQAQTLPTPVAAPAPPEAPATDENGEKLPPDGSATLSIWNREIATFRANLGNINPAHRRDLALKRLQNLPKFALYKPLTISYSTINGHQAASFMSGDTTLFVITEQDLDPTSQESVEAAVKKITTSLEELRHARLQQSSTDVILRGGGIALAATLLFVLTLWLLHRLSRSISRLFARHTGSLESLKRGNLDLRPILILISRRFVDLLFWLTAISAAYLWLTYIFAQFPYTSPWSAILGQRIAGLGSQLFSSGLAALPGLLMVLLLFFITRGIARFADYILKSFELSRNKDAIIAQDTARATRRIAKVAIWIAGVIIAYPYIPGSDSHAFKGIGVLIGLMVSLGSTGLVNQVMSGFVALYSDGLHTGEYVRIGDIEGSIKEIGLLSTKILTPMNEYITVPNAVIITKETINYSRMSGEHSSQLSIEMTIGYDTPWRDVHQMMLDAVNHTSGIRKEPAPYVLQTALSDFYTEYSLRFVPTKIEQKRQTLSQLYQNILDTFQQAQVQIMSPHFNSQPANPILPPSSPKPGTTPS
ncbi:MAG: mechanosensitive ion channel family protein [Verrucomicrobiales bacterium]|nr:mechanosensitive ion channel family protein [Verrucomicrobiales bacterium]